jgi:alpha-2-macroglobulin
VMPVSMSNTTDKPASAQVTVKVTGPLGVNGSQTQTIPIAANREGRAVFHITAQPAIGAGRVTVSVKALGETFVDETEIGVRPPASLQKMTGSGFAAQNTSTPLALKNNFIPSSVTGKIIIGKSPLTQFTRHLDDLVRYPFGCVEQTTSAAFPQLYYADLVKSMHGTMDRELNPTYNIQQAINKLQSMQQSDGGLSYWPEGGEESWWGSIYACHFLLEAKKAGYEVNAGTLDRLEEYMKFRLAKKETMTFFYNGSLKKEVAPEEVPYSMYVLAIAGQSQQAGMNYYKAHQELLTLDGRYMLAAAYSLSGQPAQAKSVLPPAFLGEIPNHCFSGSFYSYIRDEALSLNVLMDIDPNNAQVGVMSKQLSDQLAHERYLSTQENVFSILALGKVARMANKTTATATITANGRALGSTTGQPLKADVKSHVNDALAVQVKGNGGYYYFWEVDGITADGTYKEEDSYMQVRRTFYDREGHVVANNTFRQNDLIVVGITIETQYERDIDNVAITDMLPAGFEIENTRLTEMPDMKWIKEKDDPDYMDIRDDRINFFTSVGHTRRKYYYMVRAVSPGTYQLGPVQADAMYDGNFHSYHGSGIVRISEK